jgi:hypothetical protein
MTQIEPTIQGDTMQTFDPTPAIIRLRDKAQRVVASAPKGSRVYRRALGTLEVLEGFYGPAFIGRRTLLCGSGSLACSPGGEGADSLAD